MNKEEMLKILPGAKLDTLIAEKVMGWIAWEEKRGDYTYVVFQKPNEKEPYRSTQKWEQAKERYKKIEFSEINHMKHVVTGIKEWSKEINSAFEVVAQRAKDGWMMYKLSHTLSGQDEVDGYICVFLNIQTGQGFEYTADTAPEAICKAALLAVTL